MASKKKEPRKLKAGWVVLVVVLLLIGSGYAINREDPTDYTEFAKCISEKGAVMYGAYWCSHCKAQKEEFGDAFEHVNYVECTENPDACTNAGIDGFPTWIINNEKYPGKQQFSKLSSLTGCSLPEFGQ
ncbi:hypothetical protein HQ545_03705 [Candidatus Woesearchaeota archaeon]|nr:hypothetical protein [Candidatus Woesearchaeota archaeon]